MEILNKAYLVLAIVFVAFGGIQIFRWHAGVGVSSYAYFIGVLPA